MHDLGDRIKGYEAASEQILPAKLPVMLRLDGNSFSRLTDKHFDKPFDFVFETLMVNAAKEVLNYCSGAVFAYIQSDEITILLRNDQKPQTQPFLANRTQKLASLTASIASTKFTTLARDIGHDLSAQFDCRCFVVPPHEVENVLIWRQKDAFKNCIGSTAYYGLKKKYGRKTAHKMLLGKSDNERQELIFKELGINVNDIDLPRKRGRMYHKKQGTFLLRSVMDTDKFTELLKEGHVGFNDKVERSYWKLNQNLPVFTQDRQFLKDLSNV